MSGDDSQKEEASERKEVGKRKQERVRKRKERLRVNCANWDADAKKIQKTFTKNRFTSMMLAFLVSPSEQGC